MQALVETVGVVSACGVSYLSSMSDFVRRVGGSSDMRNVLYKAPVVDTGKGICVRPPFRRAAGAL